jgi:hypothetical protein
VQSHWKSIQKGVKDGTANAQELAEFVDTVITSKGGNFEEEFLARCRTVADTTETGEEGGWIPWKEAADKEGEDCLLEMVQAGTVIVRRHPKLPLNSSIPYPRNQQVKYEREVWSRKRKTTEETTHHKKEEASGSAVASHNADFEAQVQSVGKVSKKAEAAQGPQEPQPNANEQRDKEALTNVRKAHSAWDRARRDYMSVVSKSKQNESTKETKTEKDLETLIAAGNAADENICTLEVQFMGCKSFTTDDIADVVRLSQELHGLIKTGNKKAQGLRTWFNI